MQKRIVYASESIVPSDEANSIQVMRMCDAFAEAGCSVHLVARHASVCREHIDLKAFYGVERDFEIKHMSFGRGYLGRHFYGIRAAQFARKRRAEFMYARCAYSALMGCYLQISTLLELHSLPAPQSKLATKVLPRLFRHRRLRSIVCISGALKQDLLDQYQYRAKDVHILPDGASIASEDDQHSSVLPKSLDENRPIIGYLGSMYPGKGMEIVVQLARRLPEQQFVVVGGEENTLATWKQKAEDLDNLHFIGRVAPSIAKQYCKKFTIALVPNQPSVSGVNGTDIGRWTSPLKVFEYMSQGRPIIASRLPVLEEVLKDRENCLLCEASDVDSWASSIKTLVSDPPLAKSLGAHAKADFESNFSWGIRARRALELVGDGNN
jgi:glycosyltransferase involved in cell wall biosynthesis